MKYVALRIRDWHGWEVLGQKETDLNWETIMSFTSEEKALAFAFDYRNTHMDHTATIYGKNGYGVSKQPEKQFKEELMDLPVDKLIALENKAYAEYKDAEIKNSADEVLKFAIWTALDNEIYRRCNNPFERKGY